MAQTKVQLLQPDLGDVIDFDASTLFVDGADNRIGIRNTNPQYELDVTGTINATNFRGNISVGTIDDWITHTGDTNTKIGFPANDQFQIQTGGATRLTAKSTGAEINYKLEVGGAAGTPGIISLYEGGAVSEIRVTRNSDANSDLQFKTESGDGTQIRAKINYSKDFELVGNSLVLPDSIIHSGDTNTKIRFPAADTITFETAGDERLRIASDGKIGINETSPDRMLHLTAANDASSIRLENTADSPDNVWEITPAISGVSNTGFTIRDVTDSANRLVIDGSGKIGMGINAPLHNLHIKPPTASETVLKIESESGYDARLKLDTSSGGGAEARIDFEEDASIRGFISYTNNSGGTTDDMIFGTATNERLRIGSDGLLTLKNNSGMMIDLQSSAGTGSTWIEFSDTDGTRKGYLGYGSSGSEKVYWVQAKSAEMSMYSNGDDRFVVQSNGNKVVKNGRLTLLSAFIDFSGSISAPSTAAALYRPADNTLAISTANAERFRVDSTGNIHLRSASTNRIVLGSSGGSVGDLTNNENWIRGSGTMVQLNTAGGDYGFEVLGSQKMKLDSSGNLELRSAAQNRITFGSYGSSGNDTNWIRGDANKLMFNCRTSGGFDWEINGTMKMSISEYGRLLIKSDPMAVGGTMGDRGLIFTTDGAPSDGEVIQGITFNTHTTQIGRARAGIAAVANGGGGGTAYPQSGADLAFMTRYSADGHDLDVTTDQRLRIDAFGAFLFNTPIRSGLGVWNMNGQDQKARYQFYQTVGDNRGAAFHEDRGDANAFDMVLSKARGGNGTTSINAGDQLGRIIFSGADGTRQVQGAMIQAYTASSGTIASNRMPSRILIKTGTDHASSGLQNLLILNEKQNVQHSGGATWHSATTNGDFKIIVSSLTNNAGNNWRKCGVYVQYNGINGDATNSRSAVGYYGVGSVTTWNWLGTGEDEEFTADPLTVTLDSATTTSFRLNFNVADNNTGSVSVMVNAYGNSWPHIQIQA